MYIVVRTKNLEKDIDETSKQISIAIFRNQRREWPFFTFIKKILNKQQKEQETEESKNKDLQNQDVDIKKKIIEDLKHSRQQFNNRNFVESESLLLETKITFSEKLCQAPFWWRFTNVYAGYTWLFLVAVLGCVRGIVKRGRSSNKCCSMGSNWICSKSDVVS